MDFDPGRLQGCPTPVGAGQRAFPNGRRPSEEGRSAGFNEGRVRNPPGTFEKGAKRAKMSLQTRRLRCDKLNMPLPAGQRSRTECREIKVTQLIAERGSSSSTSIKIGGKNGGRGEREGYGHAPRR